MFRLYTLWELERELSPEDFQHILTPEAALEKATVSYDLDYRNYTSPPVNEVPRQRDGFNNKPYQRTGYDPVYDDLEINLMEGWVIGLDTDEDWDETVNPFHIETGGELIFNNADPFCWIVSDFQRAFRHAINNQNGRKPAPTVKFRTSGEPVQHAQAGKVINSKIAGGLMAGGGVYNGNIEGFHQAAQQLGGDTLAGYDQVMDNKELIIAGVSVVAGLTMGRMRFPELEELEHFGARGAASGRTFDPELAGGPIENLTTDGVNVTHEGIATVEKHISRFDHDPANDVMIGRLKNIAKGEFPPEQVDLNYYTHECREFQRYCNLGWESGEPEGHASYDLWNNAHTATLEDFKLKDGDLFHPDALK